MPKIKVRKKTPIKNTKTLLENIMNNHLKSKGLKEGKDYYRNCRFIPGRRYTGDFVFRDVKYVLEVDGGEYTGKGHVSGPGYSKDREKDALAFLNGWIVVRVSGSQVTGRDLYDKNKKVRDIKKMKKGNTAFKIFDATYYTRCQFFASGKEWLNNQVDTLPLS